MDTLVEHIVERIARSVNPEQVILFGSRTLGAARSRSDVDLLVLYSGPRPSRDVQIDIHRLFERPEFSMDVFVMTPLEFERQKLVANTLAREAYESGTVCYG